MSKLRRIKRRKKRTINAKRAVKSGPYSESRQKQKAARAGAPTPPLLIKIANVEDEATGEAYELYAFRKPLGRRGTERHPRGKAWDPRKLREFLVSKN